MRIVTNKNKLRIPTKKCESVETGEEISKRLFQALDEHNGFGLSANQIGINASVCVVKVRDDEEPKVLINPRIVEESSEMVSYYEGCLSIPGKGYRTIRHQSIKVACDNWVNEIEFGPDEETLAEETFWKDKGLLECVCIQHEIDHLNGKLIIDPDRKLKQEALRAVKYGRNEKVLVEKDGETQFIKYKKAQLLLEDGWKII